MDDYAAICGLYWEGSAWYATLGATCGTQGEAGLGKRCPVYTCAREHRVTQRILLVHMAAQTGRGDNRTQRTWVGSYCPLRTLNR